MYLYAIEANKFDVFIKVLSDKIEAGACGLKFICKRIKEHYASSNKYNKLPGRIIGDQDISLSCYCTRIIDVLKDDNDSPLEQLKLSALSKICEALRKLGTLMNKINVDNGHN